MKRNSYKKSLVKLSVCAMLVAISVEIGTLCRLYLTFNEFVRVTFENLPIILSGVLFGPVYGMACGACTDLVSSISSGQNINPIITLGALSVGLVAGIVSKLGKNVRITDKKRNVFACVLAHVVGSLFIKTYGLRLYYFPTTSFWYLFAIRFAVYFCICVSECFMLSLILKNKYIKGLSGYEY